MLNWSTVTASAMLRGDATVLKSQCVRQVAALPTRARDDGQLEVMLVTTRRTGRWVIPKGWPSKKLDDADAALREAWEEAGVAGQIGRKPIGCFSYLKHEPDGQLHASVDVFHLPVESLADSWPEAGERERCWFTPDAAAREVDEPELSSLIRKFATAAAAA